MKIFTLVYLINEPLSPALTLAKQTSSKIAGFSRPFHYLSRVNLSTNSLNKIFHSSSRNFKMLNYHQYLLHIWEIDTVRRKTWDINKKNTNFEPRCEIFLLLLMGQIWFSLSSLCLFLSSKWAHGVTIWKLLLEYSKISPHPLPKFGGA